MRLIIDLRSGAEACWLECTAEEYAALKAASADAKGSPFLTTAEAGDAALFRRIVDVLAWQHLLPEDWDAPRQPTTQDRLFGIPVKLR